MAKIGQKTDLQKNNQTFCDECKLTEEINISQKPANNMSLEEAIPILKSTWTMLMQNQREIGNKIYQNVLTKEISLSVLFINSQIERQSLLFMQMLDTVIKYLDDPNNLDKKLLELGAMHNDKYGVKKKHYKHFRTSFIKAIKFYIPWDDATESAWLLFWDKIIHFMSISSEKKEAVPLNLPQDTMMKYVFALHDSFDNVMQSPVIFGNKLYDALVDEQCEIANLFSKQDLDSQIVLFLSMMRHVLYLLADQEGFQSKILSLSYQYREYGVNVAKLELFGNIFIKTLKSINNDQWNSTHDEAWTWLRGIVIQLLKIASEENTTQNK